MSKTELLEALRQCATLDDTENAHVLADHALLEYVNDSDVTSAYREIRKWYA